MGNMGDHNYSLSGSCPVIHGKSQLLINSRHSEDGEDLKESPLQSPRTSSSPPLKSKKPKHRKKDIYSTASIFQRSRRKKRLKPPRKPQFPLPILFQDLSETNSTEESLPPPPSDPEEESPPILTPFLRPYTKKLPILRGRLTNEPKKSEYPMCPMCREIFTLVDYHLLLQRSSSPSLPCPFICSSSFPTPEAIKLHITSVHLFCSCSRRNMNINEQEKVPNSIITSPSPPDTLLLCQCNNQDHKNLQDHLLSQEFPPTTEISTSKVPNYLINLSSNILSPSGLSRSKKPSRTSTVNCMTCAIKLKTVKDYLNHMKKYHKKITPINVPKNKRKLDKEEMNEDEEPDSFGIWSLDESFKPKRTRSDEDFDEEVEEYLEEFKNNEESEYSEKNEDSETLKGLEDSGSDGPSTSSKENTSSGSSNRSRCYPRIIAESRDFDPVMKEYLLKLRKDHKSLSRALLSMRSRNLRKSSESLETPEILDFDEEIFLVRRECPQCGKQFHSMKELAEHFYFVQEMMEEENGGTISWRCAQCERFFKNLQVLIYHRYFIHDDESMVHICSNCCKILTSVAMVNSHECISETFECEDCDEDFEGSKELLEHNRQQHLEIVGSHDCEICKKKFLTESMMRRHRYKCKWKKGKGVGRRLQQCRICGIFWKTSKELLEHVKKIHSFELCRICNIYYPIGNFMHHVITSDLKNRASTKIIDADADVFIEFIKIIGQEHLMSLVRYVSCDRLEDKIVCQICSGTFKTELLYKIHNVRFHDLFCVLCNWRFDEANDAFEHKKKHHESIYRYIWFAEEVMRILGDTEAFARIKREFMNDEAIFDSLEKRLTGDDNGNVARSGEKNEEKDFFLIITDDDMKKYKDDVPKFAKKISESCDFISIGDIEIMLREWVFNKRICEDSSCIQIS